MTSPFYMTKPLKVLTLSAIILGLSACGSVPNKPVTAPTPKSEPTVNQTQASPGEDRQNLSLAKIQKLRADAAIQARWADYLLYSTALWHKQAHKPTIQAQIEEQAWAIVNSLPSQKIQTLANDSNPDIQAWGSLHKAFASSKYEFNTELLNLKTFESDAIYQKHLLAKLIAQKPTPKAINQIAVLLPLEGKYRVVGNQIRSGIMKAFFASEQNVTLKFYDTSELENVEATYNRAKEEGADRIIGPLRKEAIQQIASFHDDKMLVLNTVNNSAITQFSFKSANQSQQMLQRFTHSGFKRIGILTNDNKHSLASATELQQTLLRYKDSAVLSVYPDENPKLRDALGNLIHENLSKERQNNLRWLIGEKLEFFPRTRADLDAIVIFDNAHRMAVFRPQFDFFELDTPLYGDTELTPNSFQTIPENRDLNRVSFLTYPAVLNPVDLTSAFEAFGWDSFQVTMQLENLQSGACLTSAKTGILSLDGNQIKQQLIWVKYDKSGVLAEAPIVDIKSHSEEVPLIRDSDTE